MERAQIRLPKSLRVSFTFISLLVLFGVTAIAAVARAQESMEAPPLVDDALLTEAQAEPLPAPTEQALTEEFAGAALTEGQQTRVRNLAANISNRYDAIHARLTQITARLESRTEILEESNLDTGMAKIEITIAKDVLLSAQFNLAEIDRLVAAVVSSPNPGSAWQSTRAQFESIAAELTMAREALTRALTAAGTAMPHTTEDTFDAEREEQNSEVIPE